MKHNYPCKDCIVRCNCSSICLEIANSTLSDYSITNDHRCPDCGTRLVSVHEVSGSFYVMSCIHCKSRFAIEFLINSVRTIRSIIPKGGVHNGLPYETKTIATFIEEQWRTTTHEYK
jgi:hypothetical protein